MKGSSDTGQDRFKKAFLKMNFFKFFLFMITMSAAGSRRLHARGNMRGTVTFGSGLSLKQVKMVKMMARQLCFRRYGRFSYRFCWFHDKNRTILFCFPWKYTKKHTDVWPRPEIPRFHYWFWNKKVHTFFGKYLSILHEWKVSLHLHLHYKGTKQYMFV